MSPKPSKISRWLFQPIDIAPLVYFRIVGGGLITIELIGELVTGYREPYLFEHFHFSYLFFEWLEPWPPAGIYAHMLFNIAMGVLVTLGLYYRAAAALLFLGTGSLFLMEKAVYINHTYLYILVSFVLIFVPAHRALSLDVRRRPELTSATAPAWTLNLLRFQIAVVYVFAGIGKLNADWLRGMPMTLWLQRRGFYPIIGPLLRQEWLGTVMSYGGLALDLLVVPGMLWKRTRAIAFGFAAIFHVTNAIIFGIGTFPWFSLAMTALFFPPQSFRKLPGLRRRLPVATAAQLALPTEGALPPRRRRRITAVLAVYIAIQIVVPARVWLYPDSTAWTEKGHMFSWRMMLRQKGGKVEYFVHDPETGKTWWETPEHRLHPKQAEDMIGKPDMILEFAHYLAELYRERGYENVEVRARASVSLNGRPSRLMVDPEVDLAKEPLRLGPYDWILPLE